MESSYRLRIVIAAPRFLGEGVCKVLEFKEDIKIEALASYDLEVIDLVEQKRPDVLFLDPAILNSDIVRLLRTIREKSPDTKVLLLFIPWDEEVIRNYSPLGVRGYLTAESNSEHFIRAITAAVGKGKVWIEKKS